MLGRWAAVTWVGGRWPGGAGLEADPGEGSGERALDTGENGAWSGPGPCTSGCPLLRTPAWERCGGALGEQLRRREGLLVCQSGPGITPHLLPSVWSRSEGPRAVARFGEGQRERRHRRGG